MKETIKKLVLFFLTVFILTMACPVFGQDGEYKSIAINDSGYVLEVHSSTATDDMWYNLGYFSTQNSYTGEVSWVKNGRVEHGYTASDSWSRVIINGEAEVAVFFPGNDDNSKIYVVTGSIACDPNESVSNGVFYMDKPLHITWRDRYELNDLYKYMGDSGKSLHAEFSADGTQVVLRWITDEGFFYTRYSYSDLKSGNIPNYQPWQVKSENISPQGIVGYDGDSWYGVNWDIPSSGSYNPPYIAIYSPSENWNPKTIAANLAGGNNTHALGTLATVSPNGQYSVVLLPQYTEPELAKIGQFMQNMKASGKLGDVIHAIGDTLYIISGLIGDGTSFGCISKNGNSVKTSTVGSGELPVVAVNNRGWVVTEHTSGSNASWGLWIICGVFSEDGGIQWGDSHHL